MSDTAVSAECETLHILNRDVHYLSLSITRFSSTSWRWALPQTFTHRNHFSGHFPGPFDFQSPVIL